MNKFHCQGVENEKIIFQIVRISKVCDQNGESFLPPSMDYISVIITRITIYNLSHVGHSNAQGLGVAYQPYARAPTVVVFKFIT